MPAEIHRRRQCLADVPSFSVWLQEIMPCATMSAEATKILVYFIYKKSQRDPDSK